MNLRFTIFSFCIVASFTSNAQNNATFQDITIPGTYESLSLSMPSIDSTHIYQSGNGIFTLQKASWGGYSGMDVSRATDTITNSFTNDKAAITGAGFEDEQYCIAYLPSNYPAHPEETLIYNVKIDNSEALQLVKGAYFTNGTWTYRYIQENMDTLSFYSLIIKGYKDNIAQGDSIIFDLYRKTATDTILVNNWTFVDMSTFGFADSITFQLKSNHSWTPFYFAMDEMVIEEFDCFSAVDTVKVEDITKSSAKVTFETNNGGVEGLYYVISTSEALPTETETYTTSMEVNLTSLDSSTVYYVHYRTKCINDEISAFRKQSFRTLGDPLSINDNNSNLPFTLYPNPVQDKLFIKSSKIKAVEYHISDVQGKTILSGNAQDEINISMLQSGIYFIRIMDQIGIHNTAKFIKK